VRGSAKIITKFPATVFLGAGPGKQKKNGRGGKKEGGKKKKKKHEQGTKDGVIKLA